MSPHEIHNTNDLIGGFVAGIIFMALVSLVVAGVARYRYDKAVKSITDGDEG